MNTKQQAISIVLITLVSISLILWISNNKISNSIGMSDDSQISTEQIISVDQDLPPKDSDSLTSGYVTSMDLSPWAYDGNAVINISINGITRSLEVPARLNLCPAAENIVSLDELKEGDFVQASGEYVEGSNEVLVVCNSPDHFITISTPPLNTEA